MRHAERTEVWLEVRGDPNRIGVASRRVTRDADKIAAVIAVALVCVVALALWM